MGNLTKLGVHVSAAGGIYNSVEKAKSLGCTAFQIFTRSPRGWQAKDLARADIDQFKSSLSASGIRRDAVVIHMPYLPNLSAPRGDIYEKSALSLKQEAQRASELGIPNLVIHLGSHMGAGEKQGVSQLVDALKSAADFVSSRSDLIFVLENGAGQKNRLGSSFEELRSLLDALGEPGRFGVCLDTCHAFAAGYDLRTQESVERVMEEFDRTVGLDAIRVIHLNDSKGGLGSKLDRHEDIGKGNIGSEGLAAFLGHKVCGSIPVILETPKQNEADDRRNLTAVLRLAES
ncbi:MAG: deoxyribonuclease IV [Nitrososphaera sp.]